MGGAVEVEAGDRAGGALVDGAGGGFSRLWRSDAERWGLENGNYASNIARTSALRTFSVPVRGRSSTKRTCFGTL